eukprot:7798883-Lingulodinium_polyedra.AAC.1
MEWSAAAKCAMRIAAMLEYCVMVPPTIRGLVDNDAVRLAVERGSSAKMSHMKKHAEVCFSFLNQCGIKLQRVDTSENIADIFTKILS